MSPRPAMQLLLLETKRRMQKGKVLRTSFASLALHSAVIGAALYGTLHAGLRDDTVKVDTTVVLLESQQQKAPEREPTPLDAPLKGFQTVAVLPEIPTTLPPVNLLQHFDPKDYSGTGVEGGLANGVVPDPTSVYAEAVVEEKPELLSGPPPIYPELLKEAGIQGRVILRAIVDTTGRVDPASVSIVKSPHPGFNEPTRQWVIKALFRPARIHGQAVRVLINLPFDYSFGPSSAGKPGRE
jgi:periplasmic protein TonB